jgi:hypothetical protein
MSTISCALYRVDENASADPSGFQAAPVDPGIVVSRANPVPSAFTTQRSRLPAATRQSNAIFVPSGDQAGLPTNPTPCVSRTTFAFVTAT